VHLREVWRDYLRKSSGGRFEEIEEQIGLLRRRDGEDRVLEEFGA